MSFYFYNIRAVFSIGIAEKQHILYGVYGGVSIAIGVRCGAHVHVYQYTITTNPEVFTDGPVYEVKISAFIGLPQRNSSHDAVPYLLFIQVERKTTGLPVDTSE